MKQHLLSAMCCEPASQLESRSLRYGLGFWLLSFVVLMPGDASAGECRVSLSQPQVDYGVIRRAELLDEQSGRPQFSLGKRTLQLNIACPDLSPMAMRFTGAPLGTGFRFGRQGYFTLSVQQAQVDGQPVELLASRRSDDPATGHLLPGMALFASVGGSPIQGRRFTALVNLETFVPAIGLAVSGETLFEGRGSFEWVPGT
ncbi:hypothetical protein [Pseudomonas azotoformans]|nr:hypothetical protein [Pseudomonas azotoformans]